MNTNPRVGAAVVPTINGIALNPRQGVELWQGTRPTHSNTPHTIINPHSRPLEHWQQNNNGLSAVNNTLVEANDKTIPDWIGEIITNHQQNNAQVRSNKMLYYIIGAVVIIALGMLILMPSKRTTKKFK